jgi:hypothetical protein
MLPPAFPDNVSEAGVMAIVTKQGHSTDDRVSVRNSVAFAFNRSILDTHRRFPWGGQRRLTAEGAENREGRGMDENNIGEIVLGP